MMDTHSLRRTSPKPGPFIGRCVNCGKENLPAAAVFEDCQNPSRVGQSQSVLDAIEDE